MILTYTYYMICPFFSHTETIDRVLINLSVEGYWGQSIQKSILEICS